MDNICDRYFGQHRISNSNFKGTPLKSIISLVLSVTKILDEI